VAALSHTIIECALALVLVLEADILSTRCSKDDCDVTRVTF